MALYRVEHDAAENSILGTEAHDILRGERSRPIVDDIEAWIDAHKGNTPPKSTLGVALTYATNQHKALREFLADPQLPLDNNASERALRIIAVLVSLCSSSSSARNLESPVVAQISTRATGTTLVAA